MYHLWRNEMYRLGDNAQKSYVVHRRLALQHSPLHHGKHLGTPGMEVNTVVKLPFSGERILAIAIW